MFVQKQQSKMGWFWFAIFLAAALAFSAMVKEGTVELPFLPVSSASDAAEEETQETEPAATTTTTAATTAQTATLTTTTAPTQENEALDRTAARTLIIDDYSNKYHIDENCAAAQRIDEDYRDTVEMSMDEAEGRGYLPCDMCVGRE